LKVVKYFGVFFFFFLKDGTFDIDVEESRDALTDGIDRNARKVGPGLQSDRVDNPLSSGDISDNSVVHGPSEGVCRGIAAVFHLASQRQCHSLDYHRGTVDQDSVSRRVWAHTKEEKRDKLPEFCGVFLAVNAYAFVSLDSKRQLRENSSAKRAMKPGGNLIRYPRAPCVPTAPHPEVPPTSFLAYRLGTLPNGLLAGSGRDANCALIPETTDVLTDQIKNIKFSFHPSTSSQFILTP
jgi:hypothetical protein